MLLRLPLTNVLLRERVFVGRQVRHVRDPGVPAGCYLVGREFVVFVVDPAGSYCVGGCVRDEEDSWKGEGVGWGRLW